MAFDVTKVGNLSRVGLGEIEAGKRMRTTKQRQAATSARCSDIKFEKCLLAQAEGFENIELPLILSYAILFY